jgi:hypothetical protein
MKVALVLSGVTQRRFHAGSGANVATLPAPAVAGAGRAEAGVAEAGSPASRALFEHARAFACLLSEAG